MNAEMLEFIKLLRKLDFESTREFFYIVKGAAIIAATEKSKNQEV